MMAISLWQPWASLWLSAHKHHETRHWRVPARIGPLPQTIAVHAAKRFIRDVEITLADILDDEFGGHWSRELPTGAILGTVEIVGCHAIPGDPMKLAAHANDVICGDWSAGRFAWRRGAYRVFQRPIPWKGARGFFAVPDEVIAGAA